MSFQTNYSAGVRPFLMSSHIEYRFPRSLGYLRDVLFTHSRFLLILQGKIIRFKSLLAGKGLLPNLWKMIDERGVDFEPFKESVELTETLMKKIKDRAGGIPVAAFAVDPIEPYLSQFKEIFRKTGIDFIDEIPYTVMREESLGEKLRLTDNAHWNEEGHQLVGITLSQALQRLDLNQTQR